MQVDCIGLGRAALGDGYLFLGGKNRPLEPPRGLLGIKAKDKVSIVKELGIALPPNDRQRFGLKDKSQLPRLRAWFRSSPQREAIFRYSLKQAFLQGGLTTNDEKRSRVSHVGFGETILGRTVYLVSYWDVTLHDDTIPNLLRYAQNRNSGAWVLTPALIAKGGILGKHISGLGQLLLKEPT